MIYHVPIYVLCSQLFNETINLQPQYLSQFSYELGKVNQAKTNIRTKFHQTFSATCGVHELCIFGCIINQFCAIDPILCKLSWLLIKDSDRFT